VFHVTINRDGERIVALIWMSPASLRIITPLATLKPSEDDIELTKRLAKAGEIVGIEVLDHIIIGDKKYLSLKREGLF